MFDLAVLNRTPPVMVRLVARGAGRRHALPVQEIAALSGLSVKRIHEISRHSTWDSVPIGEAARFCEACGVTSRNAARHRYYFKRTLASKESPFAHTNNLPPAQRRSLQKLARGEGLKK